MEEHNKVSEYDQQKKEQDLLAGGFAVVDREQLIEEETKVVTPWYKHFIHVFTAPYQLMEECFAVDPPIGTSVGVVGSILFGVLMIFLTFVNPISRQAAFENYRLRGLGEEMLSQQYQRDEIIAMISGIIGIFFAAFLVALLLQILKAIFRDHGQLKSFFIVCLFVAMVQAAVGSLDALIQYFIGVNTTIFGIGNFLDAKALTNNIPLMLLSSNVTIANLWGIVLYVIGYKCVTKCSFKKSILVNLVLQALIILFSYGMLSLAKIAQNAMNM